jgi:hypothetical protein
MKTKVWTCVGCLNRCRSPQGFCDHCREFTAKCAVGRSLYPGTVDARVDIRLEWQDPCLNNELNHPWRFAIGGRPALDALLCGHHDQMLTAGARPASLAAVRPDKRSQSLGAAQPAAGSPDLPGPW